MAISDPMARRSREIVEEKRRLLLEGDEALLGQVGVGNDLVSIFREFTGIYIYSYSFSSAILRL